MDHDSIMIDRCFDLIECEIFWKDDRSRKRSIIALFDEHALRIEVDRCFFSFSRKSEDIAREGYIDLTRIHSGYWCYDDDLLCEIEHIDSDLSYIDLMFMISMDIYLDRIMIFVIMMSFFMNSFRDFGISSTDSEEF